MSGSIARPPCFAVELPDLCHFLFEFQHADRAHHFADRDPRIVGPEDAEILVFIVVETYFVTVSLLQRCSIPQLRTPRKKGVTEVKFIHQDTLRRRNLCCHLARRFEDRGVMSPRAGDNVTTVLPGPERRLGGLGRLGGPSDQLRPLAHQFRPAVRKVHVVADLDPQLAEVAIEDRQRIAGSSAALHRSALQGNDQVYFAVDSYHFALAPHQDGRVRAQFLLGRVEQVGRNHNIATVLPGFPRKHFLHRPRERDRAAKASSPLRP